MEKIKIVVASQYDERENIFGYILPELPDTLHIFRDSVIKGAVTNRYDFPISMVNKLREATSKDFETFRCVEEGYKTDYDYQYQRM